MSRLTSHRLILEALLQRDHEVDGIPDALAQVTLQAPDAGDAASLILATGESAHVTRHRSGLFVLSLALAEDSTTYSARPADEVRELLMDVLTGC